MLPLVPIGFLTNCARETPTVTAHYVVQATDYSVWPWRR